MSAMVDWVTARVPCSMNKRINGGELICITPDGVIDWSSERRLELEGSYAAKITVRGSGIGEVGQIEISGNPAKFLQGHNVFGSANLVGLMYKTISRIVDLLQLEPSQQDIAHWRLGEYDLTRVDVTRMYDLGTKEAVDKFLMACKAIAHGRYQLASTRPGESTVYIGQFSRRVSLKLYDKFTEMQVKGHEMNELIPSEVQGQLLDYAKGKLRVEAKLLSTQLRDLGLRLASNWSSNIAEGLLDDRLRSLELNDTMILEDALLEVIPVRLIGAYEAWRAGHDIRALVPRRTFYRYRSQLLHYGIDILHVRPREVVERTQYLLGAPLRSFLVGDGAAVPEWAVGTEFLAA
jgi:II/X family phage/plasmid replication protein